MNIPITQSDLWNNLEKDLGETTIFVKKASFQYLAIEKHTPLGNYLYLPYGPVASDTKGMRAAIDDLIKTGKQRGSIFVRVEPQLPESKAYLPKNVKKSKDISPAETWVLDLKSEDLKSKLPSRLLRYHKSMTKRGISIEKSHDPEDILHLLTLQKALASKKGINTFSEEYLATELAQPFATLYLVKYDPSKDEKSQSVTASAEKTTATPATAPEIVAAGLVFDDKTTRYNLQGAQSERGRSLHATGILTIQLILDAAEKGQQTFDFWGIAPEGAPDNHPWAGFTAFKKTFDGHEIKYAGTHDVILRPFKYRIYQFLRKIRSLI